MQYHIFHMKYFRVARAGQMLLDVGEQPAGAFSRRPRRPDTSAKPY
jgi:hypothetical protein